MCGGFCHAARAYSEGIGVNIRHEQHGSYLLKEGKNT